MVPASERRLDRSTWPLLAVGVSMAAIHLWVAAFGGPDPILFRAMHLGFALTLAFLPAVLSKAVGPRAVGLILGLASVAGCAYLFWAQDYIVARILYIDTPRAADFVLGITLTIGLLEATRRTVGAALAITAAVFMLYGLTLGGLELGGLVEQLYLTTEGIFGIPLGVSATYVILFIIFGVLVERSGAGQLFMDASLALVGHTSGGPAKVACVTSALFGSVSGSAVANVMTTGAFTIPLMKRTGYKPQFAGAVEAVASTGGQFMPPIMGATAFVMAEFLGVSYLQVATYAAIPALLYFVALFAALHFESKRDGLQGLPRADLPRLGATLRRDGHLALPLVLLVATLGAGYSAAFSAMVGILSVVPATWLRAHTRTRFTPTALVQALADAALAAVPVALACACAGIVIGVVTLTGIGVEFASLVVSVASDSALAALALTMVAGIVLGMGMPTTPAYVIQVSLLVPAIVKLGIDAPSAHLFVLYFAVLSNITPPVAMASLAANAISGARLWSTSLIALRLAAAGYLVPFLFAQHPSLLMIGSIPMIVLSAATALVGVVSLAAALSGWLLDHASWPERGLLAACAICLMLPGIGTDVAGLVLLAIVAALQWTRRVRSSSRSRSRPDALPDMSGR